MNGGYYMLDCSDKLDLLVGSQVTIAGLYDGVSKAVKSDKPIIAYNCKYNGVKSSPIAVNAYAGTNKYIAKTGVHEIEITKDDEVTVKDLTSDNRSANRTTKK